jgi:hypothetical protein
MKMASPDTISNDPKAHTLLRAAHEGGYRFPRGFAGFAATVRVVDGEHAASGRVKVRSPQDVSLEIDAGAATTAWLQHEIASMAGHRWPTPYEESDGRWTLTVESDDAHPLGRLVRVHDDPFQSSYRVRDGRIAQITRQMGPRRFSIIPHEHTITPDGRALPSHFTVVFWDLDQGRLVRSDAYQDQYVPVDGVYLPASRRVVSADDAGITVRELALSDHVIQDSLL